MRISKEKDGMTSLNTGKHAAGRAIIAIILFIIIVIAISLIVTMQYDKKRNTDNDYTCLIAGASMPGWGVNPDILNEELDCKTLKMATAGCTVNGRYAIIEDALERFPIDTVIVDVATVTLTEDTEDWTPDQETYVMAELEGAGDKISYFTSNFSFMKDQYDAAYTNWLDYGVNSWKDHINGAPVRYWITDGNGGNPSRDQVMTDEEAASSASETPINTAWVEEKVEKFEDIIRLCNDKGVRIVVISMPVSERDLWIHYDWDVFNDRISQICDSYGCEYMNYNLYKDLRNSISDETSYYDPTHLSDSGKDAFTYILADTLKKSAEGDVSKLFYDSYKEALEFSRYR